MHQRFFSTPPLFIWQCDYFLDLYNGRPPQREASFEDDRRKLERKAKKLRMKIGLKICGKKKFQLRDLMREKVEALRKMEGLPPLQRISRK